MGGEPHVHSKGFELDEHLMLINMDLRDLDTAGYLGVLISVNLFYLSLIILLTWISVHVRNKAIHGRNNSLSRQVSDRVFFSSFIFL